MTLFFYRYKEKGGKNALIKRWSKREVPSIFKGFIDSIMPSAFTLDKGDDLANFISSRLTRTRTGRHEKQGEIETRTTTRIYRRCIDVKVDDDSLSEDQAEIKRTQMHGVE